MSIFGKIMGAIFGSKAAAAPAGGAPAGGTTAGAGIGCCAVTGAAAPPQSVMLRPSSTRRPPAKGEKLEWRTSIVDLMKALDIDSKLQRAQGTGEGTRLHRRQQ